MFVIFFFLFVFSLVFFSSVIRVFSHVKLHFEFIIHSNSVYNVNVCVFVCWMKRTAAVIQKKWDFNFFLFCVCIKKENSMRKKTVFSYFWNPLEWFSTCGCQDLSLFFILLLLDAVVVWIFLFWFPFFTKLFCVVCACMCFTFFFWDTLLSNFPQSTAVEWNNVEAIIFIIISVFTDLNAK